MHLPFIAYNRAHQMYVTITCQACAGLYILFCLICSIYALQIQHFIALILLVLCLHLIGKAFSGQFIRESLSNTFQLLALSVIVISWMKFYELLAGIYIVATS